MEVQPQWVKCLGGCCRLLLAVSHHCSRSKIHGSDLPWGSWESCQWLGVGGWFNNDCLGHHPAEKKTIYYRSFHRLVHKQKINPVCQLKEINPISYHKWTVCTWMPQDVWRSTSKWDIPDCRIQNVRGLKIRLTQWLFTKICSWPFYCWIFPWHSILPNVNYWLVGILALISRKIWFQFTHRSILIMQEMQVLVCLSWIFNEPGYLDSKPIIFHKDHTLI